MSFPAAAQFRNLNRSWTTHRYRVLYQGTTLRAAKKTLLDRPGRSSNCAIPGLSVRGSGFSNPRERFFSQRPGFLAAASISPGENGPELSNEPLRLFLAHALMFCIRARL